MRCFSWSVIVDVIVGLSFLFGFGKVLVFGLRLGVSGWVAPLVAPAVDLSVLALLIAIRQLSLRGVSAEVIRPARRLLLVLSVVTLALNVAEPLIAGEIGRAQFDAVGPLLLIGWADVGVRHEALFDRVEVKGLHPLSVVTGGVELRAA